MGNQPLDVLYGARLALHMSDAQSSVFNHQKLQHDQSNACHGDIPSPVTPLRLIAVALIKNSRQNAEYPRDELRL